MVALLISSANICLELPIMPLTTSVLHHPRGWVECPAAQLARSGGAENFRKLNLAMESLCDEFIVFAHRCNIDAISTVQNTFRLVIHGGS